MSTAEVSVDIDQDWTACGQCGVLLYRKRFARLAHVCPECGWHQRLTAPERLDHLLDPRSGRAVEPGPTAVDPLAFHDRVPYRQRLAAARAETGLDDAVLVARGTIAGRPVVVAVLDFRFLGGSVGTAAGEAVVTAVDTALAHRLPLVLVTASGGARMQEGALSLVQLAKTSNAMAAMDEAGLLTVTLVTDPTFGGVAASFATLSDVIIAEPGARMGFAGPRVIRQTIAEELPEGFQTAEFLLEHGLVDDVVPRGELPQVLGVLLAAGSGHPAPEPGSIGDSSVGGADLSGSVGGSTVGEADLAGAGPAGGPTVTDPDLLAPRPVEEVLRWARDTARPTVGDHLANWCDGFVALRGDRAGADCPALVVGVALLGGRAVVVIGHRKGHSTDELVRNNFGMASPAGYRKAVRLMRLAAKLGLPVLTLVDTPGAHPGPDAERHGQAHAIAECLRVVGGLPVPVLSVITGEGGSGGAIALAAADRVLMSEHAIYSVISPEGCAAILWRTSTATAEAATALRVDARSLLRLGVVDGVVREPAGGAHTDPAGASRLLGEAVRHALDELCALDRDRLVAGRRARFRDLGGISAFDHGRLPGTGRTGE
ncbi:acetyl-CoA carboxylase, carboxyltransferase subunit beta [Actinosynnema sp. CS-041913]|uniref:acetyl-CoA carboxylase, carboxyltransferase subunit beta n=1 Tax=Actinosynnema sp. CS-041913 TaxID=3239917 RepID=UPI003D93F146